MIYVPTPELDSPAKRALDMEGWYEVEEYRCADDFSYGRLFARLWDRGEEFTICEWDVIPWPGAMGQMDDYSGPWITYKYPLAPRNITSSFGIGRYQPEGPAPAEWRETPWRLLDGAVLPVVRERLGAPLILGPPVAHARNRLETSGPGWPE